MNTENTTVEEKPETQVDTATEAPKEVVEEKKSNHNSWETRVNKLTWQKNEAKRENDALQERIKALEEQTRIKEKPVEDNFDNYKDYDRAIDKYMAQQEKDKQASIDEKIAEGVAKAQAKVEREKVADKYNAKREKAFGEFTDFANSEATVNDALQGRVDIVNLIIESDNSDKLVDYYGKHPEALAKLQNASLVSAVRLVDSVDTQSRPVSQAPAPTDNKSTGETAEKEILKMSGSEYRAWRKKNGM